jgi:hypothetical protein
MRRWISPSIVVLITATILTAPLLALTSTVSSAPHFEAVVEPLHEPISVRIVALEPVRVGKWAKVEAVVENRTGVALTEVTASLLVDSTGVEVSENPIQLRDLRSGKTTKAKWRLRPMYVSSYLLVVRITGLTPESNSTTATSGVQILKVTPKK